MQTGATTSIVASETATEVGAPRCFARWSSSPLARMKTGTTRRSCLRLPPMSRDHPEATARAGVGSSPRCWRRSRSCSGRSSEWRSAWRPDSSRAPPTRLPAIELIGFPGELFMRALRALVIPLVSVSMVAGVTSLARRSRAKRVAARLLGAYAVTTLVAAAIGLAVVHIIRPGVGVSLDACQTPAASAPASSRDALESI